jgi:hypothetical protein
MKKNSIFIFVITLISIISISTVASTALKKTSKKLITARVIFVSDNYIEFKKGKTEIKINVTEQSKFILKDGKESNKDNITVCQYVDVYYSEQADKKTLEKVIVKKDSDCVK